MSLARGLARGLASGLARGVVAGEGEAQDGGAITSYTALEVYMASTSQDYDDFEAYLVGAGEDYTDFEAGNITEEDFAP